MRVRPDAARMVLTWDAVLGASRYLIRRRGTQGFVAIGRTNALAFADAAWKPELSSEYLLQATDEKSGALSPLVRVVVQEIAPQTAPTGFTAVAGDGEQAMEKSR